MNKKKRRQLITGMDVAEEKTIWPGEMPMREGEFDLTYREGSRCA